MRPLLILLLSVITLSVTAQQRYRVTSDTRWQYDIAKRDYIPSSITKYGYVQGSTRGSNYNSNTVLYDTMRVYYIDNDSMELSRMWVRHYTVNDLLDTIYSYADISNKPFVKKKNVYTYDQKGRKVSSQEFDNRRVVDDTLVYPLSENPESKNFITKFQLVYKDSFVFVDGLRVSERRYCYLNNCGYAPRHLPNIVLRSPYLEYKHNYTYDDTLLVSESVGSEVDPKKYLTSIKYKNGKKISWSNRRMIEGKYVLVDTIYFAYEKNKRTEYNYSNLIYNPRIAQQNKVVPAKVFDQFYTDAEGRTVTHIKFCNDDCNKFYSHGHNDGIEMKEWRYEYNKDGKETLWYYNRFLDAKDRKPIEICEYHTSYTPFGYIAEKIKYDYIDPDTGEAQIKTKTTYTYEAY